MRMILLALIVTSCGGGDVSESEDNHGYGWSFHAVGAEGLHVRYTTIEHATNPLATPAVYEAEFHAVLTCTGLNAPPPPFLVFVPAGALGATVGGRFFGEPPLIVLEDSALFRHEVIHYLLNGDPNHTSPLFAKCA